MQLKSKSKSLTFRIFLSSFFTGTIIYFLCALLFISNMYSYFEKQIFSELESESIFLTQTAEKNDIPSLSMMRAKNRITLISSDGTVLFDSTVDAKKMENHGQREEFIAAREKGSSSISRYSNTMTEKTLYFAKLLSNGNVLRISCNQHSVGVLLLGMSQILIIMLLIAMIISGISASYLSKRITEPLNKIDLEHPEESEIYDELKPFTKRISEENYEKSQREELRQQFTANVSHELKTPLTSISGFAEILKAGGTDEKTTVDFASTIYEESQRMINLVNDIIKLSKLDEKSISMQKEELDLNQIASEAAEVLKAAALKKNVTISLNDKHGIINGVRPVIYEMIYNLMDNAIKYNKNGGKIEVKIENLPSAETGSSIRGKIILSVKDTGIGIPENERERIFERFYRIDKSRSKELGGTGLGLSIVKHAARYHDAKILLTSEPGKGSVFTVIFNE